MFRRLQNVHLSSTGTDCWADASGTRSTMLLIHLRALERFTASSGSHEISSAIVCCTRFSHVFSACNSLCPFLLAALAALGRGAASRAARSIPGSPRFSGQRPAHSADSVPPTAPTPHVVKSKCHRVRARGAVETGCGTRRRSLQR